MDLDRLLPELASENGCDLWCAMTNTLWVSLDSEVEHYDEDSSQNGFSWSFREAGRLIADWRNRGETYMDFYCCGQDGDVSPRILEAMHNAGWRPVS